MKVERGLVRSGSNNRFRIELGDGSCRLCPLKGKRIDDLSGTYNSLVPGDHVDVLIDPSSPERGLVASLVARRNMFGRFNEKGKSVQAIAANIDLVVCVTSPRLPPFRPRFIDRMSVLAEAAHVPLLIVMNKSDLGMDDSMRERLDGYRCLGYETVCVSAATGSGMDELRARIAGLTTVFVGQSGVGKSSLLNRFDPVGGRKTGEVSEKYERGKHTTTMALLGPAMADGTRIIDTPGFRRLALRGIEPELLVAYFPELAPLAPLCDFGLSCTHLDESGCRVVCAVASGGVHEDRYESYLRIRAELESCVEYTRPGNRDPGRKDRGGSRSPGDGTRSRSALKGILDDDE